MKIKYILSLTVLLFVVIGTFTYNKVSAIQEKNNIANMLLCNEFSQYSNDSISWKFVIYLDIDACLTCTDHIPSWINLEKQLPKYRSILLIYTNHQDSLDVAIAMKLEGVETVVQVLEEKQIKQLNPSKIRTPIKVLFDINCKPILFIDPFGSENEAKMFYSKFIKSLEKKYDEKN